MERLLRGVADLVSEAEIRARLAEAARGGRPLRVKLGVDPTSPDLHLGHTVVLRKLRQFQDLGHRAILIIGSYTAQVGDPSGRDKTRPRLTEAEVEKNAATYLAQAGRVLDLPRAEVVRNGDWFSKMRFLDVIDLAGKMTVARLLERDDFTLRHKAGEPIGLHEFLYPLMQAHDSVVVRADVEIGGTDQRFNLMVGRNLQREAGQTPQVCLMMPILVGLDGERRMGKSLGNHVAIEDPSGEMFGKAMSLPDTAMRNWFELLTEIPKDEIAALLSPDRNPKEAKVRLAREIVTQYHGGAAAGKAEEEFSRVFGAHEPPEEMEEVLLSPGDLPGGRIGLLRLIVKAGGARSNADARRLVEQGAVTLDGARIEDLRAEVAPPADRAVILKVGKRCFRRIGPTPPRP